MFRNRTFKVLSNLILLVVFCTGQVAAAPNNSAKNGTTNIELSTSTDLSSNSVMFIENVGQFGDSARFQVRGGNGVIWLAENALWVTVFDQQPKTDDPQPDSLLAMEPAIPPSTQGVNLKLSFVDANPHPRLEPFNRLETHVSYFIGDDPSKWHADVPVWGGVRYKDFYPGMDLELTSENGQMVQRLIVHPGGNSTQSACA